MSKKKEEGFTAGAIESELADFTKRKGKKAKPKLPKLPSQSPWRRQGGIFGRPPTRSVTDGLWPPSIDRIVQRQTDAADAVETPPAASPGTLEQRKEHAARKAYDLGHMMKPWFKRPNDRIGREEAYCKNCNSKVIVCAVDPSDDYPGTPMVYGDAVKSQCMFTGKKK